VEPQGRGRKSKEKYSRVEKERGVSTPGKEKKKEGRGVSLTTGGGAYQKKKF